MRHAYCILAHNEPIVLKKLVSLVDDVRNDIFIHIDKKSNIKLFNDITTKYSQLVFTDRQSVEWGGLSQVKCELLLLKTASEYGAYSYYHILSGTDLPIKTQDYIHHFCDEEHGGREFVGISNKESNLRILDKHTRYYYLFNESSRSKNKWRRILAVICRNIVLQIQTIIHFKRHFNIEMKKWHQWNSITDEFCRYILSQSDYILKTFKYICIPDEIFLQSMLWNSKYKEHAYCDEHGEMNSLRAIDWQRGGPYVWTHNDVEELRCSKALFARKFSSQDYEFIDDIIGR